MKALKRLALGSRPDDRATRRIVIALSVASFAQWGGASAVLPLLPIYLRRLGSSPALVGLTMAAFFAAAVLVQYPVGRLSDRIGRRKIQVAGLSTYAVATVLFAFVGSPVAALLLRAVQGAGVGCVDVANVAAVGEVVPERQRGRAFGALYGMRTAGLALGPLLGSLLGLSGMRELFIVAAAVVLSASVPILLFAPRFSRHAPVPKHERVPLWRNRSVVGVAVAFFAAGAVIGVYEACWSLLLTTRGAEAWQIGLSWTLFALPFTLMSLPAGWLVDHFDRRYLAAASLIATASFAAMYPFVHSVAWLLGLGTAEAIGVALGGPSETAQLAHSVNPAELGRAQGAVATMQTAAIAIAASFSGALFGVQLWLPFVTAAVITLMCTASLGVLWRGVPGRASRRVPAERVSPDPQLDAA